VAISNYFLDYAAKFGGMGFAYDLTCIGEQLVDQHRLMNHWHKVFPGQILEVDYDLLVEDVASWAEQIIDYLELPWEEGVLSFQELDRAVKTASLWQVRQPVYQSSKGKWKRYEKYLQPLEAALAAIPAVPEPLPLPGIAPALFLTGMGQLQKGALSQAESSFRTLVQARPAHAAAHHFLGATLYQQGKIAAARQEMQRSLELHHGQGQWMENLAALEEHAGNREVAAQLREAVARRTEAAVVA
jgi:tetratricopeptide (TPR) repeat protein